MTAVSIKGQPGQVTTGLWPGHGTQWLPLGIKKEMAREDWEDHEEDKGTQVRRLYLGSWQNNSPSGKIYAPFACSNVMGCDSCKGMGGHPLHARSRVAKRMASRNRRIKRTFQRRGGHASPAAMRFVSKHGDTYARGMTGRNCTACGGLGSREAYLDERWVEYSEAFIESLGYCFDQSDGDLFAVECRDKPEEREDTGT